MRLRSDIDAFALQCDHRVAKSVVGIVTTTLRGYSVACSTPLPAICFVWCVGVWGMEAMKLCILVESINLDADFEREDLSPTCASDFLLRCSEMLP